MNSTHQYISVFLLIFITLLCPAQHKELPRDTSYTAYGTWLKVRKNFPEAVLMKDSLPDDLIAYKDIPYKTIADSPYGDRQLRLNFSTRYSNLLMIKKNPAD